MSTSEAFQLAVDDTSAVSALWLQPARPVATYVFAHGAGAGMNHSFMADLSQALFAAHAAVRATAAWLPRIGR